MKRNNCRKVAVGLCGVLLGSAVFVALAFGRDPNPKAGMKAYWDKGCIQCHPILGEGGSVGPDLTRTPSISNRLELAAAMWSHAPQMWQRMRMESFQLPTFEQEEMEDLFAFLEMASSLDEGGNPDAGQQVFQSKRCTECHAIRGQGGRIGPDLATVAAYANPLAWAAAMWNHAPGMLKALEGKGIPFPRFLGREMVDLQSYVQRVAGQEPTNRSLYLRPPSADKGASLFQTKQCVRCHSIKGRGDTIGPDLSLIALPRQYGEIAPLMWNHAPQMSRLMADRSIPYPHFETQELADLLTYLNSLSLGQPGNPFAGAIAFGVKGCASCHSIKPGETSTGPNLANLQQDLTPVSIACAMWNHGPAMMERMEKFAIPWPLFTGQELADTLTFLQSLQTRSFPLSQTVPSPGNP